MPAMDSHPTTITVDGVTITGHRRVSLDPGANARRQRTTLADTGAHTYGAGLKGEGSLTIDLLLDPTNNGQRKLVQLQGTKATAAFVLTYASGTQRSFSGVVLNFVENLDVDSDANASCNIAVSGNVTGFPAPV